MLNDDGTAVLFPLYFENILQGAIIIDGKQIAQDVRADVAKKFKHPGLKALISTCQNGAGCWTFFLFEYGHFMNEDAGIPKGGSKKIIENIVINSIDEKRNAFVCNKL